MRQQLGHRATLANLFYFDSKNIFKLKDLPLICCTLVCRANLELPGDKPLLHSNPI